MSKPNQLLMENITNYGIYKELVENGIIDIYTKDITSRNWTEHFYGVLNILRDSIETEYTQKKMFIRIHFEKDKTIELSIMDYIINLMMWYFIIRANISIVSKHLFFEENITKNSIKEYIDRHFVNINRKLLTNKELNNAIDDGIQNFSKLTEFSMYLANTVNLEDTIDMMKVDDELYNSLHLDLSNKPLEDVKNIGMQHTYSVINKMKNAKGILGYDHCLADAWRAAEGINPKQFKEVTINIGSKPDGRGSVFPEIINSNFLTGGVNTILHYFLESSAGRTAQILAKMNVGSSGHFARLLGLNNMDTILHRDPNYTCNTKNFIDITIKNEEMLRIYNNRYYRSNPNGIDKLINGYEDKHLIGQTIYLRSPMTCASHAKDQGICYKCYGDLSYTNNIINIGRIASEILSAILTQRQLSAKHLLETSIKKIKWNSEHMEIFEFEGNTIKLKSDTNYKGWKLLINTDDIVLEHEDDYVDEQTGDNGYYSEYITEFTIINPNKEAFVIHTEDKDSLYISSYLSEMYNNKNDDEDKITFNLNDIKDIPLFYVILQNNGLSKTLDRLKNILNKKDITRSYDKGGIVQALVETAMEGNLDVSAIHLEVILSNQVRSIDNIIELPNWSNPNEPYTIISLGESLFNNRSITITLSYQYLKKVLFSPISFKKRKPSFMDLFFMDSPQAYLNSDSIIEEVKDTLRDDNIIIPARIIVKEDEIEEEIEDTEDM